MPPISKKKVFWWLPIAKGGLITKREPIVSGKSPIQISTYKHIYDLPRR
jgi:hypothetical protein